MSSAFPEACRVPGERGPRFTTLACSPMSLAANVVRDLGRD